MGSKATQIEPATKGLFPLERFTVTESSAVVIFTGNGHQGSIALY
jgi:hypothetical protein